MDQSKGTEAKQDEKVDTSEPFKEVDKAGSGMSKPATMQDGTA